MIDNYGENFIYKNPTVKKNIFDKDLGSADKSTDTHL